MLYCSVGYCYGLTLSVPLLGGEGSLNAVSPLGGKRAVNRTPWKQTPVLVLNLTLLTLTLTLTNLVRVNPNQSAQG